MLPKKFLLDFQNSKKQFVLFFLKTRNKFSKIPAKAILSFANRKTLFIRENSTVFFFLIFDIYWSILKLA